MFRLVLGSTSLQDNVRSDILNGFKRASLYRNFCTCRSAFWSSLTHPEPSNDHNDDVFVLHRDDLDCQLRDVVPAHEADCAKCNNEAEARATSFLNGSVTQDELLEFDDVTALCAQIHSCDASLYYAYMQFPNAEGCYHVVYQSDRAPRKSHAYTWLKDDTEVSSRYLIEHPDDTRINWQCVRQR